MNEQEIDIGEKIRKIREIKGYSQLYVASKLDISQRAYSKIERNENSISWEKIIRLANIFNISPSELITFDDSVIFQFYTEKGRLEYKNNHLSEELIESLRNRIRSLEIEINFLRNLIQKELI